MNYAIMRLKKIKSVSGFSGIEHHDRDRESLYLAHPERTNQNKHITGKRFYTPDQSLKERFEKCLNGQKPRKNAVLAYEIVLTFSPAAESFVDLHRWTLDNARWLGTTFGGQKTVLDIELHMDETTPHLHAIICPLDPHGRLNAKYYTGSRQRLSELQDSYATAMQPHGLNRGVKYYDVKERRYHKTHHKYNAEIKRKKIEEIKKELFR